MRRSSFDREGLRLSYLDAGGAGRPLVALHSHWFEAATFEPLAEALAPEWRVIALDQRGHGYSDHAANYGRDDYLGDLDASLDHLGLERVVLVGNSLGGLNAYQFAARQPRRVAALIVEEMGAEADVDAPVLDWCGVFASREELAARIGPRFAPYLEPSFRETAEGWRLAFDPHDMVDSQEAVNGDHWDDWLASDCPALLLRGRDSRLSSEPEFELMARRRPNTRLVTLDGGHVPHVDNPHAFTTAVREFLATLPRAA